MMSFNPRDKRNKECVLCGIKLDGGNVALLEGAVTLDISGFRWCQKCLDVRVAAAKKKLYNVGGRKK